MVSLSKGEDVEASGNKVIEVIILLHRLMRLMVPADRHREVINLRIQEILAKGILAKYEKANELVKQIVADPNFNFTEHLAKPDY